MVRIVLNQQVASAPSSKAWCSSSIRWLKNKKKGKKNKTKQKANNTATGSVESDENVHFQQINCNQQWNLRFATRAIPVTINLIGYARLIQLRSPSYLNWNAIFALSSYLLIGAISIDANRFPEKNYIGPKMGHGTQKWRPTDSVSHRYHSARRIQTRGAFPNVLAPYS